MIGPMLAACRMNWDAGCQAAQTRIEAAAPYLTAVLVIEIVVIVGFVIWERFYKGKAE